MKFKSGYQNDNIIFEDNKVRFCPKNIAINNYNIAKIPTRYSKCKNITLIMVAGKSLEQIKVYKML